MMICIVDKLTNIQKQKFPIHCNITHCRRIQKHELHLGEIKSYKTDGICILPFLFKNYESKLGWLQKLDYNVMEQHFLT